MSKKVSPEPSSFLQDLEKHKSLIMEFLAQHRGIVYEPKDLQAALIAHNYPFQEIAPDVFEWLIEELVGEGKIQVYVGLT